MASYLQCLDGGIRTPSALSDELRNDLWANDGQGRTIIAPLGRTFLERLRLVDPDRLIVFQKRLVRRALRPHLRLRGRHYRPIVAIDATLLLLRGDFEGKGLSHSINTPRKSLGCSVSISYVSGISSG